MNNELLIEIVTLWKEYKESIVKTFNDEFPIGATNDTIYETTTLTSFLNYLTTKLISEPSKEGLVQQVSPEQVQLQKQRELSKVKDVASLLTTHKEEHKDDLS